MYKIPKTNLKAKIDEILDLIQLSDRKNDYIKTYSGGMKRRINIAVALLHSPEVLFMDEPTVGVDPQSRNHIYSILQKLHNQGKTILYTSHYIDEVEKMCSKIGIMDSGKIITEGTLQEIRKKHTAGVKIIIETHKNSLQKLGIEKKMSIPITISEKKIELIAKNTSANLAEITNILNNNITIKNIDIQKANLETIFLKLTGKKLRD